MGEDQQKHDLVLSALTDGIWHINVNREEKRNAITIPMFSALAESLRLADARDDVRSILVTGAGANFCAGHDLDSFSEWPQALLDPVPTFLHTIADVRKPVVIAVHGSAVGIAVTWLLHADWVVTSAATTFRLPFIDLGIAPEAASTILLKGAVGIARARRLLLGGEKFTGAQAFDWGLVAEVVEFEDVVAAGWRRAAFLASKDPLLLRQIKDWLHPAQAVHHRINQEVAVINEAVLRLNSKSKEHVV